MKFIPYPMYWDDVPIDISYLFDEEKPAGKHGFNKVEEEEFVFEDGTKMCFWGTNFNSGGNFPDFDFSEKIAKRLSKVGINIVRFHQLDSEWATPNIFQFTKGKRIESSGKLDPESMKRFDYLVYCLKNEGIYMYLDMLTYRKFKSGDGVENALLLKDAAKPYCLYNRRLIELQKQFIFDIWNHTNEFTELQYKDEPAIVMTEIINEGDMFSLLVEIEPYKSELVGIFKKYLVDNNIKYDTDDIDFKSTDTVMLNFKIYIQEQYFNEMMQYMREIGVKVPIAGTNWNKGVANTSTYGVCDFCDGHAYYYNWGWKEYEKNVDTRSQLTDQNTMFGYLSMCNIAGKAFFVSEWDQVWPNIYRAESPIWLAAVNSLQGWMGCTIHTYSYLTRRDLNIVGKEISSFAIGGIPYREGVFATFNDPAKFGMFYHAALITRRGDVEKSNKSYAYKIDDISTEFTEMEDLSLLTEVSRIGFKFDEEKKDSLIEITSNEKIIDKSKGELISDNGQVYRNWRKGYGWIDTKMTKAVYGRIANTRINLDSMSIRVQNDFAVVALSSICENQITDADNMLLTVMGQSKNTNMEYSEDGKKLENIGEEPILVEVINADISIKTNIKNLKVWAVGAEGFFTGVIPSRYIDGRLEFTLGNEYVSMYYLIQSE